MTNMQIFEVAEIPSGIQAFLIRKNKKFGNQAKESNHYWVTDLCKCLRQWYYESLILLLMRKHKRLKPNLYGHFKVASICII